MNLGQAHDTPLGLGQKLCEILFKINMTVRSYGMDKECCDYNYYEGKCWLINPILQQSAILKSTLAFVTYILVKFTHEDIILSTWDINQTRILKMSGRAPQGIV